MKEERGDGKKEKKKPILTFGRNLSKYNNIIRRNGFW
jgi:hypothetical protein